MLVIYRQSIFVKQKTFIIILIKYQLYSMNDKQKKYLY